MRFVFLALTFTACTTTNEPSTVELSAQQAWLQVALPALRTADCTSCHGAAGDFLAGASDLDIRDTLLASGMVSLDDGMYNSPILTKGVHSGDALTVAEQQALLTWLEAE